MNIYQRINKVRESVKYVKKDSRVQGYMAVTHDMVTAMVRDHLIEQGILIVSSQEEGASVDIGTTKSGTPMIRYEAWYTIEFVNVDEPQDKIQMRIQAHANDTGDKAPGKALSYAVKYAMLKLLNIETGENEESRIEGERKVRPISESDVKNIRTMLEQLGKTEAEFLNTLKAVNVSVSNLDEMNQQSHAWAKQFLTKKLQEKGRAAGH